MLLKVLKSCGLIAVFLIVPGFTPKAVTQDALPDEGAVENMAFFDEDKDLTKVIRRADASAAAGDWEKAMVLYQGALEIALDKDLFPVFPAKQSLEDKMILYVNPIDYCRKRLLQMDRETLAKYRHLYEEKAANRLKAALKKADFDMLPDVGERYPFTESGLRALTLAADAAVERGDYPAAARGYDRALEAGTAWRPSTGDLLKEYAVLAAKAARAYASVGWAREVDGLKGRVSGDDELSSVEIMYMGRRMALADVLGDVIRSIRPPRPKPVSGYPTFGGDGTRGMVMPGLSGDPGGVNWRHTIMPLNRRYRPAWAEKSPHEVSCLLLPTPTAEGGRLFVTTGENLLVMDEFDGKVAYVFPAGAAPSARLWLHHGVGGAAAEFCTVYEGIAYLTSSVRAQVDGRTHHTRALCAIDARAGREIWHSIGDTGLPCDETISSAPVARNGEILFETWKDEVDQTRYYLLCVDAKTGKLKWRCRIAGTVGLGRPSRWGGGRGPQPADIVAVDGDTAVVASSPGAVTAVDLRTGRLKWAVRCHQDYTAYLRSEPRMWKERHALTWCVSQPIAYNGRVIVRPRGSTRLYCLDAETGDVRWTLRMPTLRSLAGVDDGKLFVIDTHIMIIDVETGKLLHIGRDRIGVPVGRPALTKSAMFISTPEALLKFDRKTRIVKKLFEWCEEDIRPGNLLFTRSGLYIVNLNEVVALYPPQAVAEASEQLRKRPDDPLLLYRRGKALLAARRFEEALTDFTRASEKATLPIRESGRPLSGLLDEGLYACYMALSSGRAAEGALDTAVHYARLALKTAATDKTRVNALVLIGGLHEKGRGEKSWRSAIDSYQQIIANYPEQMSKYGEVLEQSACYYAAGRIRAILAAHGRGIYFAHEGEAAKLLADVGMNPTVSGYLNIYERYPNSIAALKALTLLAAMHEREGRKSMALVVLKAIAQRLEDDEGGAPVLLELQRVAWECGDYVRARAALERLAKMPGDLALEIKGRKRSVRAYAAERLKEFNGLRAKAAGEVELSKNPALARTIKLGGEAVGRYGVRSGFLKVQGPRPLDMIDKILTTRNGVVECWDVNTGKLLWSYYPEGVWLGLQVTFHKGPVVQEVLAGHQAEKSGIAGNDRLVRINGKPVDTGESFRDALSSVKPGDRVSVVYSRDSKEIEVKIVATKTPVAFTGVIYKAWYNGEGNVVVETRRYGKAELRCLDIKTGQALWCKSIPASGRVVVNDILACIDAPPREKRERQVLTLLDLSTGAVTARFTLQERFEREIGLVADNLVLAERRTRTCRVFDMLTGREKFRIPISGAPFTVAGDRLLVLTDDAQRFRVIDLRTGSQIHSGEGPPQYSAAVSDRYLVIYWRWKQGILVFDSLAASLLPRVNPGLVMEKVVTCGGRFFFIGIADRDHVLVSYDASLNKLVLRRKIPGLERFLWQRAEVHGNNVVLFYVSNARDKTMLGLRVLNADDGKEIYQYKGSVEGRCATGAVIRDGSLYVLMGDEVIVVR